MPHVVENWRPVVGYEGLYEVSDLGRVRSLDRVVSGPNRWGSVTSYLARGRIMRHKYASKLRYPTVALCREGEVKYRYVHDLVLSAFVGPRPAGMQACHNNGDHQDCRLANLRWDAPAENNRDKIAHGSDQFGHRNAMAKLEPRHVVEIRRLAGRAPQRELAARFGVQQQHISRIVNRKRWPHV